MPKEIPFPTKPVSPPKNKDEIKNAPAMTELIDSSLLPSSDKEEMPNETEIKTEIPEESPPVETIPEKSPEKETIPEKSPEKETMPDVLNKENVVVVAGKQIELKPTKLKYFRNKTTSAYGYIKAVPLTELLTFDKGVLDKTKDADQLLFDFLVAAFDDPDFVTENYNEMTADEIEQVIKIFGRINHIDEKEEAARKNREAQAKR